MASKYGWKHQQERARWAPVVASGQAVCCEIVCLMPTRTIRPDEPWDLAHTPDGGAYLGPSHAPCNRSEGATRGNRARHGAEAPLTSQNAGDFLEDGSSKTPLSCSSLSPDERLAWNPDYLRTFPWLADVAEVPEDAAPPLMMTPVPDDAVCSYAWDGCAHTATPAIAWGERDMRVKLRWWQRLSMLRTLEHRADGSLCFRKELNSAPRRSGKSVKIKVHACWRLQFGQKLFGEVQTAIHTGSDMAICREIQRGAWRWAEARDWVVTRGNGKEAIETPTEDRWLVRAQDAVYGYDVCLGMVDEAWDVKPDTLSEGLEPAALERSSPQILITSTAHRRATSMMRSELSAAMSLEDPETLLLLWAAPLNADPADPEVWRAASPHWTEDRRKMIAAKYRKALAGQDDPEFDDPDPMKGFEAQYLNKWRIREPKQVGRPVVDGETWRGMAAPVPDAPPDVVAVEAWFDQGVAVAQAWDTDDGVIVSVADCVDVPDAAATVEATGCRGQVIVGASLADHQAWIDSTTTITPRTGSMRQVVADFAQALKEQRFRHGRSGVLTEQALAMRVTETSEGVRVVSKERADAVKAATWAIKAALDDYDVMDSIG